jgi:Flp pilus assembly protein TadD
LEARDFDGGLADCDYAMTLDPHLARASFCRGMALYSKNDSAGAITAFARAIELDPGMAAAHGNLGWVLWQLGRQAEAEKEFAECLRLDDSLRPALERRAREAQLKRAKP